jgi:hypothetical protein
MGHNQQGGLHTNSVPTGARHFKINPGAEMKRYANFSQKVPGTYAAKRI